MRKFELWICGFFKSAPETVIDFAPFLVRHLDCARNILVLEEGVLIASVELQCSGCPVFQRAVLIIVKPDIHAAQGIGWKRIIIAPVNM